MDEIQKGRRNLLIVAGVLIVYQLAGGSLVAINSPAVSIKLDHPEYIIFFVWLMLLYEAIRFKILIDENNETGQAFRTRESEVILNKRIRTRAFHAAHDIEKSPNRGTTLSGILNIQIQEKAVIERKLFKRKLLAFYSSSGILKSIDLPVNWLDTFTMELRADFIDTSVSDYLEFRLPIHCAWLAVFLQLVSIFNIYLDISFSGFSA
ncbi:hypothetical protein [Metapseudomonas otitidis]|uniref:hypothetical protein n=1 Tax=Metapseudomonas otitidis TaxID=319939 RepID=UPI002811034E|nr:hypothetical protein [Pseudomonas otitidis]WMR30993.1 hypothetical protein QT513_17500 [Pseudomonas otitidis]